MTVATDPLLRRSTRPQADADARQPVVSAMGIALSAGLFVATLLGPNPTTAQSPELRTIYGEITNLYQAGEFERAITVTKTGIKLSEAEFGENHVATAALINNLAVFHKELGQYEEAQPLYERALQIRRDQLGPNHLDVAQSLNNLAVLYLAMGQLEDAEPLYEEALAIREDNLDPYHPDVAQSLNNLAVLYAALDRPDDAEDYYNEALDLLAASGTEAARRLQEATLRNLADLYTQQGRDDEAANAMAQADELSDGGTPSLRRASSEESEAASQQTASASPEPVPTDAATEETVPAEVGSGDGASEEGGADAAAVQASSGASDQSEGVTAGAAPPLAAAASDAGEEAEQVPQPDRVQGEPMDTAADAEPEMSEASASAETGSSMAESSEADRAQVAAVTDAGSRERLGIDLVRSALATIDQVNANLAEIKRSGRAIDEEIGTLPTVKTATAEIPRPFEVQVGVYFKREIATLWVKRVRERGYETRMVERIRNNGDPYYSVRFGRFGSREDARKAARQFKRKEKLDALVVENKS